MKPPAFPKEFDEFDLMWRGMSEKKRSQLLSLSLTYSSFRKRYRNDLEGFVLNCFNWNKEKGQYPSEDQLLILRKFQKEKRASIRALHGVGKTALASWIVIWFSLTRDVDTDWKAVTTASAWRQLSKYLWPEIHKWIKKLKFETIGINRFKRNDKLLTMSLNLSTGSAFAVASNNYEYIEGAHADSILYVFDESKAIPPETWDAAEGAFSTAGKDMGESREAFLLSISTPGEAIGRFWDIQSRKPGYKDWWIYHCTLENALDQKRVSRDWINNRREQWGENSALFLNRCKGEFAQEEEDSVVSLRLVEQAILRYDEKYEEMVPDQVGIDPARFGGDKSCLAKRKKLQINKLKRWSKKDLMHSSGVVIGSVSSNKKIRILVDVIGLGAGLYDRLKEQKYHVRPFNAANSTNKKDRSKELGFINKRSAGWWMMRELLEDGEIALPDDELLIGDLVAPKWGVTSSGKIKVESKDEIRKRISRSTDSADAVIMAYWKEREPGISV